MIDREYPLAVGRQAQLVGISRGTVYYQPEPVSEKNLQWMRRIDELHLEQPTAGARMLRELLRDAGFKVGRRHVATLMWRMGIDAIYRHPRTSTKHPGHKIYPYPLARATIETISLIKDHNGLSDLRIASFVRQPILISSQSSDLA